jgi:hypothetical protein
MRLGYVVTLEFAEKAPLTARGEIEVPNPRLGARRAVEAALQAYPNQHFQSLVILLERVAEDAQAVPATGPASRKVA